METTKKIGFAKYNAGFIYLLNKREKIIYYHGNNRLRKMLLKYIMREINCYATAAIKNHKK